MQRAGSSSVSSFAWYYRQLELRDAVLPRSRGLRPAHHRCLQNAVEGLNRLRFGSIASAADRSFAFAGVRVATCAGFGISLTPWFGSFARRTDGSVPPWRRQESLVSLVCLPPEQPTHYAPEYASGRAAGPVFEHPDCRVCQPVGATAWPIGWSTPQGGVRQKLRLHCGPRRRSSA